MLRRFQLLFAISFLISLTKFAKASYSVQIRSGKSKCFTIRTPNDYESKFSGHFELVDEFLSPEPLSFRIINQENNGIPYESDGKPAGNFHFNSRGAYKICIGNGIDPNTTAATRPVDKETRTVGFHIRVKTINTIHEDTPGPLTEQISSIDDLTDDMLFNLEELLDHIEIMNERERLHRDVTEKTFRNVWVWTLVEKLVLVVVSVGQVMYIKYYIRSKRGLAY